MSTIVLTRLVPHYRAALFQRLHEAYGWTVASASSPPSTCDLNLVSRAPWLKLFDFRWPNPTRLNRVRVPLARILRETGADTVIAEGAMAMSSTWALPWLRTTRVGPTVIFWSHGWNMERGFEGPLNKMAQLARMIPFRFADGHVCYSEEGAAWVRRFLPAGRVFVARNSIDVTGIRERTANIRPAKRQTRGPHLLSVGRFTADKRFDRLVSLVRKLRRLFPELTMTLVGDGPLREVIEREGADLVGKGLFLVGALYDEEQLASHFKSADLLVCLGAAGLAINHALAYGLPVVAYDRIPGGPRHHPEIAYVVDGITGWRVRPATETAFVDTIFRSLSGSSPPRQRLGVRLESFVRENLLLDRTVEDFGSVHEFAQRRVACSP